MTDLLSGLRHPRARGYEKAYPQGYSPHQAYNEALDDATAALRNPTDEQVDAIGRATERVGRLSSEQIRAVLAAAAGSDE